MSRRAEGWKLVPRGNILRVRFTHEGERHEITTGESDPIKAGLIAARIYSDVISGVVNIDAGGALIHPGTPLEDVCADWLVAIAPEIGKVDERGRGTPKTYETYARHWVKHFKTIGGAIDGAQIANYGRERLKSVTRKTVKKELGTFRGFLDWCEEQKKIRAVPVVRLPKKKATGVRHPQGRKPPMPITPAQAEAIIASVPVWSRKRDGKGWPLRDFFAFCFETALRPEGTVDRLVEGDLTAFGLHIRPEADKNRWERTIPLSPRAKSILENLRTGDAARPFFGAHDRREAWRTAARAALGEADGDRVNPYDLKHCRCSKWRSEGKDPLGITFLTGVREALEHYMQPSRTAADRVLEGDRGADSGAILGRSGGASCEGRELNPHESYLTSTSIESPVAGQRETKGQTRAVGAPKGRLDRDTGAAPQIDSAAFRARARAWFRRVV